MRMQLLILVSLILACFNLQAEEQQGVISELKAEERAFNIGVYRYQIRDEVKIFAAGLDHQSFNFSILRDGTMVQVEFSSGEKRIVSQIKLLIQ